MNLMMTLSLFSALAIGRIPAYLLAKAKQTDRKGQGEIHDFKTLISIPARKSKPNWVAVATKDRTINPDLERWYAARANSHKVEVEGASHSVYVSRPKDVGALIEEAASKAH